MSHYKERFSKEESILGVKGLYLNTLEQELAQLTGKKILITLKQPKRKPCHHQEKVNKERILMLLKTVCLIRQFRDQKKEIVIAALAKKLGLPISYRLYKAFEFAGVDYKDLWILEEVRGRKAGNKNESSILEKRLPEIAIMVAELKIEGKSTSLENVAKKMWITRQALNTSLQRGGVKAVDVGIDGKGTKFWWDNFLEIVEKIDQAIDQMEEEWIKISVNSVCQRAGIAPKTLRRALGFKELESWEVGICNEWSQFWLQKKKTLSNRVKKAIVSVMDKGRNMNMTNIGREMGLNGTILGRRLKKMGLKVVKGRLVEL